MEIAKRLVSAAEDGRLISGILWRLRRLWRFVDPLREQFYRRTLGLPDQKISAPPFVSSHGESSALPESAALRAALDRALADSAGLPASIREIEGMSGQRYRSFINRLVALTPNARYLEVGSWIGSTATAALHGNSVEALCIDDWSQFDGPRAAFFDNIERVRSSNVAFRFIESDFRRVDYSSIGKFNIFLFDGPHEEQDQYDGVMVARPALDERFVLIVDDWNWRRVRIGTFRAVRDAGYSIPFSIEIRTTRDDSHPSVYGKSSDWHNGYFIAVLTSA